MLKTVRERVDDPNIYRVYWATLALGTAYGLAISVLAPYLDQRGFSKTAIGELAAWFASGIVALSLPMGWLIRRFSAKATLAVSVVGYATTVGVFPLLDASCGDLERNALAASSGPARKAALCRVIRANREDILVLSPDQRWPRNLRNVGV
jgi:MFS family permease